MGARQSVVNTQPGLGFAGDFCSANPRFFAQFGAGGAVAGAGGLTIGRFCWAVPPIDADGASAWIVNSGSGVPLGITPRQQQALITTYLADASMVIPQGFEVSVCTDADLFVINDGASPAIPGQKAYADFATGKVTFAATATVTAGGTSTTSMIAAETFSVTASVLGDTMSVSAVGSGTVQPGSVISGTNVISGTTVASQITPLLAGEAAGGVGRYLLSTPQPTITSETITGTWGLLTVSGTVVAGYPVGAVLTGGTTATGSTITANAANGVALTGTGGAGTYVTQTQTVTSSAIDASAVNVETAYAATSYGAAGALVKISRHAHA